MVQEQEKRIAQYYAKGLNAKEIAALVGLTARTIQRYIKSKLKETAKEKPRPLRQKALEYVAAGFSYAEAARRFKVSKTTVYKWAKKAKEAAQL